MFQFFKNCSYIFKLDKKLQEGKPTIRKITKQNSGIYTIAIPPKIVSDIQNTLNTNKLEISIRTGRELMCELKDLDNTQYIILKPFIDEKEDIKEVENAS